MDIKLPTWNEIHRMQQDKDKISLGIAYTIAGLLVLSSVFGILALIGGQWKCWANVVDWLKVGVGICLLTATIVSIRFPFTRANFISKKKKRRETTIINKTGDILKKFKVWLADKYMDGALHTETENHQRFHRDKTTVADMRIGDKYEVPWLLEVSFDDLEDVYPKNEADKEIDGEIRKRVFDELESSRILKVEAKYTAYTFWNTGEYPELFKEYELDYWDILF